ncbi:MAG: tRNA (5-methylaminomethyl-2-thiouridine)(34)-methyltransferase MnmD [Bacteroidota bacterium]|nr:MAG: tRNA (5-methylaminomethyl-2-thiouridine)(34)-methyltransferase MnmD [Bacteroidota bacterium]
MEVKIIETADGSSSLFVPGLNECYHSVHGAVQESMHVFIAAGLQSISKNSIRIFEMGYGTGLNFLLTYLNRGIHSIDYHAIDAFPLKDAVIKKLNYVQNLSLKPEEAELFERFHQSEGRVLHHECFSWHKSKCTLENYEAQVKFDLIYFDAFAPAIQPELWTIEVFEKLFAILNPGGILTTYCAKGQVRRNMQAAGFVTERLPGPPGKFEMLRASHP